jgi:hypothetical protein
MVLVRGGITVKPHVQKTADEVVAEFGPSLSPGTYNGHSPPEGATQALDLFNQQSQAGWELQRRVADYLIKHAKRLGVRYVIRWNPNGNDWIWNIERADEGWRAMATRDHRNHVHVTFYASVIWTEPETPAPIKGDIMALSVRYIWGPDALNQTDWVFDGPSRIFAQVGVLGVLKAADACKFPELGRVDNQTHAWFRDVAAGWANRD